MKNKLGVLCVFCALAMLFLAASPQASAQSMDDTWIELKISAKGYTVNAAGDVVTKAKFKAMAYMHLVWDTDHYDYEVSLLSKNDMK